MSWRARLSAYRWWNETVLVAVLASLALYAWRSDPKFLLPATQIGLASDVWELALLALPMTLIVITAGIDLSVGSTMALAAVVLGLVNEAHGATGILVLVAVATGALAGAFNGVFVAVVRVHPLIVTLATLAAYRGIAEGISQGRAISGFPASFAALGQGSLIGVPVPGLILAVLAVAFGLTLARTPFGLATYAIGHNEGAARFSGLAVSRCKLLLYTLSGATAGLCAAIYAARRNTAKADIGSGIELDVITAVVLGGTSIFGGSGRIVGTLLGVLTIHEVRKFVSWHWEQDELNAIVVGALLIIAVLANRLFSRSDR
jgi:rhamnose transport system permease protein